MTSKNTDEQKQKSNNTVTDKTNKKLNSFRENTLINCLALIEQLVDTHKIAIIFKMFLVVVAL